MKYVAKMIRNGNALKLKFTSGSVNNVVGGNFIFKE